MRRTRKAALKEKPDTFGAITGCLCGSRGCRRSQPQLLSACQQDEHRVIAGREQTVGAGLGMEREHLLPLAIEGADLPGRLILSDTT
jgi:hypothetical protein